MAATPLALAACNAATVAGLRIDPDGHLVEVAVPLRATLWALAEFTDPAHGPAGLRAHHLDRDLVLWTGEPGHGTYNPVVSVAAAMFGCPGRTDGPVVFTGWTPPTPAAPDWQVDHIGVAAVLLLAGTAADCDLSDRTAQRGAELARLDLHIAAPPPATDDATRKDFHDNEDLDDDEQGSDGEVYDPLRRTVTRDGTWPRCATSWQITVLGHEEHHPVAVAVTDTGPVARLGR